MKQHITVEQAKEISAEQFYSLFDEIVERKNWTEYHHKKITIGKMIEILGDEIAEMSPTWNDDNKIIRWAVDVCNANYGGWFSSEELCDALWEAVKKVL
jgi:hypothetical protein